MAHRPTHRGAAGIGTILILTLVLLSAACGTEEVEVATTAATTATEAAALTISQIDLLSGMLQ